MLLLLFICCLCCLCSKLARHWFPPRRAWLAPCWLTVSTLVHFGAVVADAPSPLSTPRSAAGQQAQLRLGKPLRKKCRASPDAFRHAGRVVAGTVGIVRATVPFHGEHDALEPTQVGLRFSTCPPSHPGDVFPFGGSGCRRTSVRPPAAADP